MKKFALILSAVVLFSGFSPALALAGGPPPMPIMPSPPQAGIPTVQDTLGRLIALQQRISDVITNSQFPIDATQVASVMNDISSELSQLAGIIQKSSLPFPGDLLRLDMQIDQTRQKLDYITMGH